MFVGHNSNRITPSEQSLTVASAVAHGFDRLERLFSKRKFGSVRKAKQKSKVSIIPEPSPPPPPPSQPEEEDDQEERVVFPEPSFIRPTASRMVARDDVSSSKSSKSGSPRTRSRSRSVVDVSRSPRASPRLSRRLSVPSSHRAGGGSSSRNSTGSLAPHIPRRSSSLISYNRVAHLSLASLVHYEYTELEGRNAERSLASLSLRAPPPRNPPPPVLRTQLEEPPREIPRQFRLFPRVDTPPPSDPEENGASTPLGNTPKMRPQSPAPCQPTPEPSPTLSPLPDVELRPPTPTDDSEITPILQREDSDLRLMQARDSVDSSRAPASDASPTRGEQNDKDVAAASPATVDPVLQEPAMRDFLGLSDDDIAEPHPGPADAASADDSSESDTRPATADGPGSPKSPTSPSRKSLRDFDANPQSPPPVALPPSPRLIRRISARLSVASTDDRGAATAAFEVARIASRYRFDLIYVISLWPQHMLRRGPRPRFASDIFGPASPPPTAGGSSATRPSTRASTRLSRDSEAAFDTTVLSSIDEHSDTAATTDAHGGLNYRFLAAYGLHTVKAPLNISYGVHAKILQNRGWIEYREPSPKDDEFARGYACSFYTGNAPVAGDLRRASADSCDADNEADDADQSGTVGARSTSSRGEEKRRTSADTFGRERQRSGSIATTRSGDSVTPENNRGIIFAAYRKPRTDGSDLAMTGVELREMQRDAETLVDMILDFHMMKRRGQQMGQRSRATGGKVVSEGGGREESLASLQGGVRPRTSI